MYFNFVFSLNVALFFLKHEDTKAQRHREKQKNKRLLAFVTFSVFDSNQLIPFFETQRHEGTEARRHRGTEKNKKNQIKKLRVFVTSCLRGSKQLFLFF